MACSSTRTNQKRWNGTPAMRCEINRVIRRCRRRQSAASQRNEGARSHPRLAPDFREARFSSCMIVQLPQPSHLPHWPSANDSTCTDACLYSDTVKLNCCNAVLHSIPSSNIQKLQHVQNSAAWIILQAPRQPHTKPLLRQLHWLQIQHRITYKLAVLTHKVRSTSMPVFLSLHIKLRDSVQMLHSTTTTRLSEPFACTAFAKRAFHCSAPAT